MTAIQAVLLNNQGVLYRDEKPRKSKKARYPVHVTRQQLLLMFDLLTMLGRSDRFEMPSSDAAEYLHRCSCRTCANEVAKRVVVERYGGQLIHVILEEEDGDHGPCWTYSNSSGCHASKPAKERNLERLKQAMRKMGMELCFRRGENGFNKYEHWFSIGKTYYWLRVIERLLDMTPGKRAFSLRKRKEVYWELGRPLGLNLINDRIGEKAKAGELIFGVSRKLSWEQFVAKQAKKKPKAGVS